MSAVIEINTAIEDTLRAEAELARKLRTIGERHGAEYGVHQMARTLARQCDDQLRELGSMAARYEAPASGDTIPDAPSLLQTVGRDSSERLRRPELLSDLRKLYLAAQEAELAWVILGQAAQAVRDPDLLDVTGKCNEHAEARGKWLRSRIKESAPRVLATG